MGNIGSFRNKCCYSNYANVWLAIVFALTIFIKNVVAHYLIFHSILVSSLWHDPLVFFEFYLSKLAPALFLASFVFITKSKIWTIVVEFLLDIWIICNILYYNANDFLLDVPSICMAGNMFKYALWNTLSLYWQSLLLILPAISILYMSFLVLFKTCKRKRQYIPFVLGLLLSYLSVCPTYYMRSKWYPPVSKEYMQFALKNDLEDYKGLQYYNYRWQFYVPFIEVWENGRRNGLITTNYVYRYSISSYLPALFIYHTSEQFETNSEETLDFTLPTFCVDVDGEREATPTSIVVVLVESLESWIFENEQIANEVMPNMYGLIHNPNTLYCSRIVSQVKAGVSGDGQLIINTGLLPVNKGTVCGNYGRRNVFPNYAHFYDSAFIVNPWPHIWNQDIMTYKYGYKTELMADSTDEYMFHTLSDKISSVYPKTFCALGITVASHSPFNRVREVTFSLLRDAPMYLQKYSSCLNYTDSCFGEFLRQLPRDVTLVVTGDHTIFKNNMICDFAEFATKNGLSSLQNGKNYCPLIICSPNIKEKIMIDDICYQMDVYPTILPLIGCKDYYWQGFGVNLLDSVARYNRPITPEDAFDLSDKMIRANYFKVLQDSLNCN